MNIHEAIRSIYEGNDVALPEWGGYWTKGENGLIKVVTVNGEIKYTPYLDKFYDRLDFYIKKRALMDKQVITSMNL